MRNLFGTASLITAIAGGVVIVACMVMPPRPRVLEDLAWVLTWFPLLPLALGILGIVVGEPSLRRCVLGVCIAVSDAGLWIGFSLHQLFFAKWF